MEEFEEAVDPPLPAGRMSVGAVGPTSVVVHRGVSIPLGSGRIGVLHADAGEGLCLQGLHGLGLLVALVVAAEEVEDPVHDKVRGVVRHDLVRRIVTAYDEDMRAGIEGRR